MVNFKRVLVPVDFSSESGLAVKWAICLLRDTRGATIFLLHVFHWVTYPICVAGCMCAVAVEDDCERLKWEKEKKELEGWQEKIPDSIGSDVIVETGCLATAVRRACERYAVDLVIMTKRTRCSLSRLFHPHACIRIVRSAPCPVLVLHLDRKTQELVHLVDDSSRKQ